MNEREKAAQVLAIKTFAEGMKSFSTTEEISAFCQMICVVSIKTINGIEGKEFKNDFLTGAMNDNERIVPQRLN